MPKYVIERELPGAGSLTKDQLHAISQTSCDVLGKLGPQIQWIESYVTARQGGFPANKVSEVTTIIDPTTAE